jgi:hypothetical protein
MKYKSKIPTECFTSFARINIKLLEEIREAKAFIEFPSAGEIISKIEQTQTKSILPDGWKYK